MRRLGISRQWIGRDTSIGIVAAIILLIGESSPALAQQPSHEIDARAAFVGWAKSAAHPLRTVDPNPSEQDLAQICDLVGRAPVVALGEPGHGAHQPLAWRNRLFFHLATHCGFTAIAIETGFSESRAVHDFVLDGAGNAADITRRSLSWGFGEYAENAELIRWMKDYNRRKNGRRKLEFYGIDLSGADNDSGFPHGEIALEQVVKYLKRVAPQGSRGLLVRLTPVLHQISTVGYAQLAVARDSALDAALESLNVYLVHHAAVLQRSSSISDYAWALRGVVVARRLRDLLALNIGPPPPGGGMSPEEYKEVNVRDAAMADNVLWVKQQEGKRGRILVFAHNAHVMNAESRGGIWSVFSEPPRMMGEHLRAALGASLMIIGTSAAHNAAPLPSSAPLEDSVDDTLAQVGLPLFVLDLRPASHDNGALDWLDHTHPLRANFSSEIDVDLHNAFDAVVFIDTVTPAHRLAESSEK